MARHESNGACRTKRGFTLTELLVASALALVVMGAVASLFVILGRSIRNSQATVELGARVRAAIWLLRQDLVGVTCRVEPTLAPDENAGYFELIEGPLRDASFALDTQGPTANLSADTDDILLFTTQSLAGPFMGRYGGTTIESPFAEVAWFCRPCAKQPVEGLTLYDLHRRQLLVVAYLGQTTGTTNSLPTTADRAAYDLSLRRATLDGLGTRLVPNSLGDLTKREHRFLRDGYSFVTTGTQTLSVAPQDFPFAFPVVSTTISTGTTVMLARPEAGLDATARSWEDIVLTNVVAFDVRVFDPQARPQQAGDAWLLPGDPGYGDEQSDVSGSYVDLGWKQRGISLTRENFPPRGQTPFNSGGVFITGTDKSTLMRPSRALVERSFFWCTKTSGTVSTVLGRKPNAENLLCTMISFQGTPLLKAGMIVSGTNSASRVPFGTFVDNVATDQNGLVAWITNFREDLASSVNISAGDQLCFYEPLPHYDTWSSHYEINGVNDDQDFVDRNDSGTLDPGENDMVDEGSAGVDVNADGYPDDLAQTETSAPYPVPLRGLEVRIRCYEPSSKQVRQTTIRHSFQR